MPKGVSTLFFKAKTPIIFAKFINSASEFASENTEKNSNQNQSKTKTEHISQAYATKHHSTLASCDAKTQNKKQQHILFYKYILYLFNQINI